eukprot:2161396-Rhodomonas_salina.1
MHGQCWHLVCAVSNIVSVGIWSVLCQTWSVSASGQCCVKHGQCRHPANRRSSRCQRRGALASNGLILARRGALGHGHGVALEPAGGIKICAIGFGFGGYGGFGVGKRDATKTNKSESERSVA